MSYDNNLVENPLIQEGTLPLPPSSSQSLQNILTISNLPLHIVRSTSDISPNDKLTSVADSGRLIDIGANYGRDSHNISQYPHVSMLSIATDVKDYPKYPKLDTVSCHPSIPAHSSYSGRDVTPTSTSRGPYVSSSSKLSPIKEVSTPLPGSPPQSYTHTHTQPLACPHTHSEVQTSGREGAAKRRPFSGDSSKFSIPAPSTPLPMPPDASLGSDSAMLSNASLSTNQSLSSGASLPNSASLPSSGSLGSEGHGFTASNTTHTYLRPSSLPSSLSPPPSAPLPPPPAQHPPAPPTQHTHAHHAPTPMPAVMAPHCYPQHSAPMALPAAPLSSSSSSAYIPRPASQQLQGPPPPTRRPPSAPLPSPSPTPTQASPSSSTSAPQHHVPAPQHRPPRRSVLHNMPVTASTAMPAQVSLPTCLTTHAQAQAHLSASRASTAHSQIRARTPQLSGISLNLEKTHESGKSPEIPDSSSPGVDADVASPAFLLSSASTPSHTPVPRLPAPTRAPPLPEAHAQAPGHTLRQHHSYTHTHPQPQTQQHPGHYHHHQQHQQPLPSSSQPRMQRRSSDISDILAFNAALDSGKRKLSSPGHMMHLTQQQDSIQRPGDTMQRTCAVYSSEGVAEEPVAVQSVEIRIDAVDHHDSNPTATNVTNPSMKEIVVAGAPTPFTNAPTDSSYTLSRSSSPLSFSFSPSLSPCTCSFLPVPALPLPSRPSSPLILTDSDSPQPQLHTQTRPSTHMQPRALPPPPLPLAPLGASGEGQASGVGVAVGADADVGDDGAQRTMRVSLQPIPHTTQARQEAQPGLLADSDSRTLHPEGGESGSRASRLRVRMSVSPVPLTRMLTPSRTHTRTLARTPSRSLSPAIKPSPSPSPPPYAAHSPSPSPSHSHASILSLARTRSFSSPPPSTRAHASPNTIATATDSVHTNTVGNTTATTTVTSTADYTRIASLRGNDLGRLVLGATQDPPLTAAITQRPDTTQRRPLCMPSLASLQAFDAAVQRRRQGIHARKNPIPNPEISERKTTDKAVMTERSDFLLIRADDHRVDRHGDNLYVFVDRDDDSPPPPPPPPRSPPPSTRHAQQSSTLGAATAANRHYTATEGCYAVKAGLRVTPCVDSDADTPSDASASEPTTPATPMSSAAPSPTSSAASFLSITDINTARNTNAAVVPSPAAVNAAVSAAAGAQPLVSVLPTSIVLPMSAGLSVPVTLPPAPDSASPAATDQLDAHVSHAHTSHTHTTTDPCVTKTVTHADARTSHAVDTRTKNTTTTTAPYTATNLRSSATPVPEKTLRSESTLLNVSALRSDRPTLYSNTIHSVPKTNRYFPYNPYFSLYGPLSPTAATGDGKDNNANDNPDTASGALLPATQLPSSPSPTPGLGASLLAYRRHSAPILPGLNASGNEFSGIQFPPLISPSLSRAPSGDLRLAQTHSLSTSSHSTHTHTHSNAHASAQGPGTSAAAGAVVGAAGATDTAVAAVASTSAGIGVGGVAAGTGMGMGVAPLHIAGEPLYSGHTSADISGDAEDAEYSTVAVYRTTTQRRETTERADAVYQPDTGHERERDVVYLSPNMRYGTGSYASGSQSQQMKVRSLRRPLSGKTVSGKHNSYQTSEKSAFSSRSPLNNGVFVPPGTPTASGSLGGAGGLGASAYTSPTSPAPFDTNTNAGTAMGIGIGTYTLSRRRSMGVSSATVVEFVEALHRRRLQSCDNLLRRYPCLAQVCDAGGYTMLYHAIVVGCEAVAVRLLELGADASACVSRRVLATKDEATVDDGANEAGDGDADGDMGLSTSMGTGIHVGVVDASVDAGEEEGEEEGVVVIEELGTSTSAVSAKAAKEKISRDDSIAPDFGVSDFQNSDNITKTAASVASSLHPALSTTTVTTAVTSASASAAASPATAYRTLGGDVRPFGADGRSVAGEYQPSHRRGSSLDVALLKTFSFDANTTATATSTSTSTSAAVGVGMGAGVSMIDVSAPPRQLPLPTAVPASTPWSSSPPSSPPSAAALSTPPADPTLWRTIQMPLVHLAVELRAYGVVEAMLQSCRTGVVCTSEQGGGDEGSGGGGSAGGNYKTDPHPSPMCSQHSHNHHHHHMSLATLLSLRDSLARTPLMVAVCVGSAALATRLLQHGADVEASDEHGRSPLLVAAMLNHTACIRALLAASAQVNTVNEYGHHPLAAAVECGSREAVAALLAAKADVNAVDRELSSLLMLAVDASNLVLTRSLLQLHAAVNYCNPATGFSALSCAVLRDDALAVKVLLEAGACVDNAVLCRQKHHEHEVKRKRDKEKEKEKQKEKDLGNGKRDKKDKMDEPHPSDSAVILAASTSDGASMHTTSTSASYLHNGASTSGSVRHPPTTLHHAYTTSDSTSTSTSLKRPSSTSSSSSSSLTTTTSTTYASIPASSPGQPLPLSSRKHRTTLIDATPIALACANKSKTCLEYLCAYGVNDAVMEESSKYRQYYYDMYAYIQHAKKKYQKKQACAIMPKDQGWSEVDS